MRRDRGGTKRATGWTAGPLFRLLAWLLVVPLAFGSLPAPALAEAAEQMAEEGVAESAGGTGAPADQGEGSPAGQGAGIAEGNAPAGDDATAEEDKASEETPAAEEGQMAEEESGDGVPQAAAGDAALAAQSEDPSLSAQSVSVSNPRVVADSGMESGQVATWDCVWFGSYPQTEVGPEDAIYASLQSASWDASGDATVGGARYRRIRKSAATYSGYWSSDGYESATYRYFRYEPIKWRVLEVSGSRALAVSDVALDDQEYNTNCAYVTWEWSSVRSWLNGYGPSSNQPGTDYSGGSFVGTALSPEELAAVSVTDVANANGTYNGTMGGSDTRDRAFLLSEAEVHGSSATSHGFASDYGTLDEARRCRASDYARAMGARRSTSSSYEGNCWWWLRSPGRYSSCAVLAYEHGFVLIDGSPVDGYNIAVRPALTLDLSSPLVFYAGTVSSDGTVDERDILITSVELSDSSYTYDGQNTPVVVVRAGEAYVPSGGYDVSYSNNSGVGTATVTVTGKGPYAGEASATFQITLRPVTVTADDKYKALGAADPELTATVDGLVGDDVVDYALSRAEGEALGQYAITPSGDAEQGNYAVAYVPGKLTIAKAIISGDAIAPISDQTFTGSAIEPEVAVTLDGHELAPGTDFDVSYANNVNVGTATATVTGKGDYAGTKTVEFQIARKSVTVRGKEVTKEYGAVDPTASELVDVEGLLGDDTVAYAVNREQGEALGEYAITPSGAAEQGNYAVTYVPGKLTIERASIASASVAEVPVQRLKNGVACPKPEVRLAGKLLRLNTDYQLSYRENNKVGTATVIAEGIGNYCGTIESTFEISDKYVIPSGGGSVDVGESLGKGQSVSIVFTAQEDCFGTLETILGSQSNSGFDCKLTRGEDVVNEWKISYSKNDTNGPLPLLPGEYTLTLSNNTYGDTMVVTSVACAFAGLPDMTPSIAGRYQLERERNDTAASAEELVFGRAIYGTLCSGSTDITFSDYDWYHFSMAKKGDLVMGIKAPFMAYRNTNASLTLQIMDSSGKPATSGTHRLLWGKNASQSSGYDTDLSEALIECGSLDAGDYYVRIMGDDNTINMSLMGYGRNDIWYRFAVNTAPSDISKATIATIKGRGYDGKPYEPKPKVTLGGRTLEEGVDFDFSYKNNVYASNGNPATLTVTGKGNYTGTKTASFEVWKNGQPMDAWKVARSAPAASLASRDVTVEAPIHVAHAISAGKPLEYRKKGGDSRLNVDTDTGRVTVRKGTPAGTYKVTIRAIAHGGANYADGSRTVDCQVKVVSGKLDQDLQVTAVDVSRTAASLAGADYLTRPFSVALAAGGVTYKKASGSGCLDVDSSGRLKVAKGTKAGTYYVKVWATAAGDAGYNACTRTVTVKVVVK